MKLLHLARISNNITNGVNAVVPKHIIWQAKGNEVAFVNFNSIAIDGLEAFQLEYNSKDILRQFIEKFGGAPDLVIFHEVNNWENINAYKQLVANKVPYIILPHGELTKQALQRKWLKKKIAYLLFFNSYIKNALALQCLSKNEAENTKIKKKKFIGTNGITNSENKKTEFNQDRINFVYIGRLDVSQKGLDLMLRAFNEKRDWLKPYNARLDIFGPDVFHRAEKVRELIKENNLQEFAYLHEPVLFEEKSKVLLNSDIFIQTSRFEGMPVGLLEAINMGLPIIYTEGTNLSEFAFYDFGYNAGNSVETIAEAIEKAVLDRDNWKDMALNGIEMTIKNFSWGSVSKATVEKYKEIIGEAKL